MQTAAINSPIRNGIQLSSSIPPTISAPIPTALPPPVSDAFHFLQPYTSSPADNNKANNPPRSPPMRNTTAPAIRTRPAAVFPFMLSPLSSASRIRNPPDSRNDPRFDFLCDPGPIFLAGPARRAAPASADGLRMRPAPAAF